MSAVDVVVVGGGVIGAACARAAARRGLAVVVCDPGPLAGAASPASAGILAAQIDQDDAAMLALGVRARDLYDGLAAELADTTGIDIGLWRDGALTVAFDDDRAAALEATVARQRQAGLVCDWLDGAEVRERWPGAAGGCHGALFAPEDGALDPAALTRALTADAAAAGVVHRAVRVTALLRDEARVVGVRAEQERIAARHVVIAAGAWSAQIGELPRPLPVEPVRGQLLAARWPAGTPPIIVFHDHAYVLARGAEAIVGATVEHVGFDASVTAAGVAQLRAAAARLFPGIALDDAPRTWAGLRPVTPDGRPFVGPDAEADGLWYATGHGRNGILLAGLTGEIIGDLLATGETAIDWSPLRPR